MPEFGPEPHAFFDGIYRETPPWDIGRPQPALVELLDRYPPGEPIVDVGCGSGDLAILLAQRGFEVHGIDFVEAAIAQARSKAAALAPDVTRHLEFEVGDAFRLSRLGRQVGAVVDSGFFHVFDAPAREAFAGELARSLRSGGAYYLLAFAIEFPIPNTPYRIEAEEIRMLFTEQRGWRVRELGSAEFMSRIAPVPALLACIERLD